MGLFSKDIKTMEDLFLHTLQDIYYAEQQIEKNLPTMAEKAADSGLAALFSKHLGETKAHIQRLEQVFRSYGEAPKGVDCPAIDGILKETREIIGNTEDRRVLDAAMLAAAQAIEHYEITRYGTLIAWAAELGHAPLAAPLEQTLKEEKAADAKLSELAKQRLNARAAA